MKLKKLIKQLFCLHDSISIETKVSHPSDPLLLIQSVVLCTKCKKALKNASNSQCCHVQHIHNEIIMEKFLCEYRKVRDSQQIKEVIKNGEI